MDSEQMSTSRFSNLSSNRTTPYCTQYSVLDRIKILKFINFDKKNIFSCTVLLIMEYRERFGSKSVRFDSE